FFTGDQKAGPVVRLLPLKRRAVRMLAVADRRRFADTNEPLSRSESQNQIVIFTVDSLRGKAADGEKDLSFDDRLSGTDVCLVVRAGEDVAVPATLEYLRGNLRQRCRI